MVGLHQDKWDIIISIIEGNLEVTEVTLKTSKSKLSPTQILELKEHGSDLSEIINDIADQLAE